MASKINWLFGKSIVNNKEIDKINNHFDIRLPDDYIICIKKNNGGEPDPNVFNMPDGKQEEIRRLITLDKIITKHNNLAEYLNNVIPFAEDNFGNYICFDYREDKDKNPTVVFWEHEVNNTDNSIKKICNSFTELLEMLYEYIEE